MGDASVCVWWYRAIHDFGRSLDASTPWNASDHYGPGRFFWCRLLAMEEGPPEPRMWTLRINPDGVGIVGGWAEGDIPGFQGEMVEVIEKAAYDAAVDDQERIENGEAERDACDRVEKAEAERDAAVELLREVERLDERPQQGIIDYGPHIERRRAFLATQGPSNDEVQTEAVAKAWASGGE